MSLHYSQYLCQFCGALTKKGETHICSLARSQGSQYCCPNCGVWLKLGQNHTCKGTMNNLVGTVCNICRAWVAYGAAHNCVQPTPRPEVTLPPQPVFYPYGCICPAGANLTCAAPACPRKAPKL